MGLPADGCDSTTRTLAQIAGLRAAPQPELTILRRRVKAQRAELRRLNKYLGPYSAGFRRGGEISDAACLRGKMAKVFGWDAVREAENGQ